LIAQEDFTVIKELCRVLPIKVCISLKKFMGVMLPLAREI
jgi:hypothetical protein